MDTPFLRIEESGEVFPLRDEVTTVGRGQGVDIRLDDPSVSRLHAELDPPGTLRLRRRPRFITERNPG